MTSTTTAHVGYLDGWRGIALLFLLIGHFFPGGGINLGHVGVFLFFVLSGYLMSDLLFIKRTPIPLFYKRRVSRIFPALICYVACVVVFCAATARTIAWDEVFGALFFLNYPHLNARIEMPSVGHIWSLSIEEHAYVLLSLVAIAARAGKVKALWLVGALATACVLVTVAMWPDRLADRAGIFKWLQFEAFGYGLFLSGALLLAFQGKRIPAMPALVYVLVFSAGVLSHWWSIPMPVQLVFGMGLFAVVLQSLKTAPPSIQAMLSWKPLRMLGTWSYSIYLWQQPFFVAQDNGVILWYVSLPCAIACGLVSYYAVEAPARNYLNARWRSRAAVAASIDMTKRA